jgi:nucleotide-binding universal stress UspA family protein
MLPIRTILVPTDFSEGSAAAFRIACSLARDYGATVVVLHVAPPAIVYTGLVPGPTKEMYQGQLESWLDGQTMPDLRVNLESRLREGEARDEILAAAGEESCDLIVMGSHGRTGLERVLLGSVAEAVLRRAHCPVLTVKALPHAQEATETSPHAKAVVMF